VKKIILCVAALVLASSAFANKDKQNMNSRTKALESEVSILKEEISSLKNKQTNDEQSGLAKNFLEPYAHGSAVVTSPLIGLRESYDASDLMVNLPQVNEDLALLKERKQLDAKAVKNNIPVPNRPIISVSGGVEGRAIVANDYHSSTTTDFDLSRAEIDIIGEIEPAVTAAMVISYENGTLPDMIRIHNSRIKLDRGFITIGNLNKCPVYFTLGQIAVPFGDFTSYMVTLPMTNLLGKIKQRAAVLGFYQNGLYASAYGFQGDTHVDHEVDMIKRGGFNAGYEFQHGKISGNFGAGYTGNIAESLTMQETGFPLFTGFEGQEELHNRVPAVDVHGMLVFGQQGESQLDLAAEYIGATKDFDLYDMMFNHHGAKPAAADFEAQYEFKVMNKPSAFAIGYGKTWEALAVNLPESNYYASAHTSLWKDTIESIEFRHDKYYTSHDSASGLHSQMIRPDGSKSRNVVTMQLGVYF
jgi:hypothetical protein